MRGTAARAGRHARRSAEVLELGALALLAYIPFLLSSPGKVAGDTKQYLYLDPGGLIARAVSMWDPHIAAGTVPHQQIGYLWPMGPYYWVLERLSVPVWISQRIWLGTISLAAVLGARWLFRMLGTRRVGALAGALVYMLTPYQLAFTARMSVLLLAWAGLPWLVGLTIRATRRGGWADPAIIALVIVTIGSVNASTLLFALVGPGLWVVMELFGGREAARAAIAATARAGALTVGVCAWWIVGLRLQGAYGLPVLQLTENLRVVSSRSSPPDILRGIGNWFFYGTDRLGYSIVQADSYSRHHIAQVCSYAIPVVALASAAFVKWRHRAYFALLVVAGVVIGTGAWPYDDPSLVGRLWKSFANGTSAGLALRNTARVAPVIVLGLAGLLASAVSAIDLRRVAIGAAALVALLAVGGLFPVWRAGYLSSGVERPGQIPAYWTQAAAAIERGGSATRAFEIPGANFAAYRWGNTIDPILPGLVDRPTIAREVLPYGSPQTVNLLDAIDRRMQEGTFEPASLAPVSRLFGVGTVVVRSDLQYERFGLPLPDPFWAALTQPRAPGLAAPAVFGPPAVTLPTVSPIAVASASAPAPPAVALFGVQDAVPIVHSAPATHPIVLSGDGDGIVDAAAAGLLDGRSLLFESAALDDSQLHAELAAGADLVVTDSNRRRPEQWFTSLSHNKGATERVGQTLPDPNLESYPLDPFPGTNDDSRTVGEQIGGTVDATADGGTGRPEDRAVHAFDGDPRTAWRVDLPDPTGNSITVRPDHPVRTDHVTLVQAQSGANDRVLTKVRLRFDGGAAVTVDLGPASLTPAGQVVRFPARNVRRLTVELVEARAPATNPAAVNGVGFASIELGGLRIRETVRLPVELTNRAGTSAASHSLDLVMTRWRMDPADAQYQDPELALDRTFAIPDRRTFTLAGTVRVEPNAPDPVIDAALGTGAPGTTFTSSSHLLGSADARASRAFDGDPTTAWTPDVGVQTGQWLDAATDHPVTLDHVELHLVADGQHSVPTRLLLQADGGVSRTLDLPAVVDGTVPGTVRDVTVTFPALVTTHVRLTVEAVRGVTADHNPADVGLTQPIAIADVGLAGVPAAAPAAVASSCRDNLVRVDGRPLAVRVTGPPTAARTGLALVSCAGPLALGPGNHTLTAAEGLDTGLDVDRVVLSSAAGGTAGTVGVRGVDVTSSGARVVASHVGSTSADVTVRTDGKPFWLVFGESHSTGWKASATGATVGSTQVVDGYANGFLVRPAHAGTVTITLRWTPQRLVWLGFAVSGVAVAICVVLLVRARRRKGSRPVVVADAPRWSWPAGTRAPALAWSTAVGAAVVTGGVTAACSRPWMGLAAGLAVLAAALVPRLLLVVDLAAPVVVVVGVVKNTTGSLELGWLAVALFAGSAVLRVLRDRQRNPRVPSD